MPADPVSNKTTIFRQVSGWVSLAGCFFLLANAPLQAAGSSALEQANQSFADGDYAAAATAYDKLLTTDGPRAGVLYNLGNSYQRLGQYGPAILAYERARLLTPRDPDLLANLTLARQAAAAFEPTHRNPRLDALLNHFSRNEWSWLVAAAALFLGGLAVLSGTLGLPHRGWRLATIAAATLTGLALVSGAAALYQRRNEASHGIVLSAKAAVRLSPFDQAEVLGTPGAGHSVRLGATNGSFRYVEVPGTNLCGWMSDTEVAAITPAANDTNLGNFPNFQP
ncbi:MAG: tetratricopeptide repeat protein [Verrucomicrobiota bacterium]